MTIANVKSPVAAIAPTAEIVFPAALSLPDWPESSGPVDANGTSFLILSFGGLESAEVAGRWMAEAKNHGPTTLAVFDTFDDEAAAALPGILERVRVGVRIMVVGGQHDVLAALAVARSCGAGETESRGFATHTRDLAFYCAHCRATHRAEVAPGENVRCPACDRMLEIHAALNRSRGSFLASATEARNLP